MNRTLILLLALSAPLPVGCDRRPTAPSTVAAPADYAVVDALLHRMHARLTLMHTVAQVKWNTQAPSFDPEREQALLRAVIERGKTHSLDAEFTRAFFTAQMDAAKLVQEQDFQQWRAKGQPPFTDIPDLSTMRKQLDAINHELLALLAQARALLADTEGQKQLDALAMPLFADFAAPVRDTALLPLRR